jgi:membrane-associated protease RseP (regulator of RpoE activity)
MLEWDGIAWMMILGYFSLLALIFIHELGHFAAAHLVGIRIKKFIVGAGYRLQFSMGGTLWSFRLIPSHGYVVSELSPKSFSLFRQGLYSSGGLLAQSALMFTIYWYFSAHWSNTWAEESYSLWYVGSAVLLFGAVAGVRNAIPSTGVIAGQPFANDGLLLYRLWKDRKALPQRRQELNELMSVRELFETGSIGAAKDKLEAFREKHGSGFEMLCLASHYASEENQFAAARAFLETALKLKPHPDAERVRVLDGLASMVIYYDLKESLADAELWIREARVAAPDQITLDGTLGSILAELGKSDEAQAMLTAVFKNSKSGLDQAISAAYLAKLAHKRGDIVEAKTWIGKARKRGTDHIVVERIGRQLMNP